MYRSTLRCVNKPFLSGLNIVTDSHRKAYELHKCYLLLLYTYVIYTTLGEYYNSRMPNFYQIDQWNDKLYYLSVCR